MGDGFARRGSSQLGSVILATVATLRRNVGAEKFLVATDAARREGLIKRLASDLHSAFEESGIPATKVETISDHGQLVLCSAAQSWGMAPDFPLPPEESVGIVVEGTEETPAMVFKNPAGKYVIVAGNRANAERRLTFKLGGKYLETTLAPHSFQTFVED